MFFTHIRQAEYYSKAVIQCNAMKKNKEKEQKIEKLIFYLSYIHIICALIMCSVFLFILFKYFHSLTEHISIFFLLKFNT